MSKWQILPDAGNSFRWEISGPGLETDPADESNGVSSHMSTRLPSMADLLLQGCSKLLEDDGEGVEKTPMFRTGLGRLVPVKQSSIAKALSVLGDDAATDTGRCSAGQVQTRDNGCDFSDCLFQTGSGKKVNISSKGLSRAKTLLGLDEDSNSCSFQGFEDTKKPSVTDSCSTWENSSPLTKGVNDYGTVENVSVARSSSISKADFGQSRFKNEAKPKLMQPKMHNSAPKPPPIKFQTAGGRSLSVSSEALKRARSLLGDPELGTFLSEVEADDPTFAFSKEKSFNDCFLNKENEPHASLDKAKSKPVSKSFVSPLRPSSNPMQSVKLESMNSGTNLIQQFDEVSNDNICRSDINLTRQQKPPNNGFCAPNNSLANGSGLKKSSVGQSIGRELADISNASREPILEKRRLVRNSVTPFKRPRSSKFSTPLSSNMSVLPNGLSTFSSEKSCSRRRVSTRYPFQVSRVYIKEYFGGPPSLHNMLVGSTDQFRWIRSDNAEKYRFPDDSGERCIGPEAFLHMLAHSGASVQCASKDWVTNHYKWIIWKLACYARCYATKSGGKFMTISNVLEELKYRYEREVNHGHRSAIKRILEGDALPSSMMVLCISAICSNCDPNIEALGDADNPRAAIVELSDGWYSMDAHLDAPLLKQLESGKLFVGQKLRIWGAALCGWVGPISPLEVSKTARLVLHMNGTYRAHWADRLGFCKRLGIPLAFKCIKSNGGPVPQTLVGITRIYPVLFKEKLCNGRSVVRSERMETKLGQSYNQRRSVVVEGIISDFHRGMNNSHIYNDSDSEEGAEIFKILESASQPEVLMADMSPDQLSSFAKYQAKLEAKRQSDMEKSIEKALEDSGLVKREVNPFMRVRVVGLASKMHHGEDSTREGLITIWNPTEKQQTELVEGKAYNVAGLLPINSDADTTYLQARGSTTWQPLSPQAIENFKPFFKPRKSVSLSNLGEVPCSSEFDIAAFVIFVGEVHISAHQKKQWVFVTDSSISELQSKELSDSLLAICFSSPYIDDDSFVSINRNLEGSKVGFCNLIKRAKDQVNHIWVAEASENSTYFLNFDSPQCSHLKDAALSAERWGKTSSLAIDELRKKILFIIGANGN
ncbi:hypothetical protein UlMin_000915 [Ulmus minor]